MAVKTAPESIFMDQASDLGSVRLHKSEVYLNGESRRRPRAMFSLPAKHCSCVDFLHCAPVVFSLQ